MVWIKRDTWGGIIGGIVVNTLALILYLVATKVFLVNILVALPFDYEEVLLIKLFGTNFSITAIDVIVYCFYSYKIFDSIFDGLVNCILNLSVWLFLTLILFVNASFIGTSIGVITIVIDWSFLSGEFSFSILWILLPFIAYYSVDLLIEIYIHVKGDKIEEKEGKKSKEKIEINFIEPENVISTQYSDKAKPDIIKKVVKSKNSVTYYLKKQKTQ